MKEQSPPLLVFCSHPSESGPDTTGTNSSSRGARPASLWRRLHHDERGAVSLETILIIGAIALPILIFLVRIGWPMVKDMFSNNMERLEIESDRVGNGG